MKSFLSLSFLSSLNMYFFYGTPDVFFTVPMMYFYGTPDVFFTVPLIYSIRCPCFFTVPLLNFLLYPCFFTVPLIYILYGAPVFLRYPWYIFYGTPDIFFTVPLMYCSELLCNDACANFTLTFFLLSATLHSEAKANSCKTKLKSGFKDLVKLNLSLVLKIL